MKPTKDKKLNDYLIKSIVKFSVEVTTEGLELSQQITFLNNLLSKLEQMGYNR
jgi:hypothetical protein